VDADNLCGALAIVGSLLVYGRGLAGLVLKVHNSINEPYASSWRTSTKKPSDHMDKPTSGQSIDQFGNITCFEST
jgi:hypothetical protein